METQVIQATEYRNVSLSLLNESKTNPRRTFEEVALKELAESIRTQGVLSPLLVRPLTENGFEIIAGARRYRAAQIAEQSTVPVRIVNLSDAQAVEMSIVENLQRKDVQLARLIPGASKKVLAQHLRKLEADGIIVREDKSDVVLHIEYELSNAYRHLVCSLLDQLSQSGAFYLAETGTRTETD